MLWSGRESLTSRHVDAVDTLQRVDTDENLRRIRVKQAIRLSSFALVLQSKCNKIMWLQPVPKAVSASHGSFDSGSGCRVEKMTSMEGLDILRLRVDDFRTAHYPRRDNWLIANLAIKRKAGWHRKSFG